MKKYYFLLLVFLSVALAGYSQKSYWKSFDITFSGGNNGNICASGGCTDACCMGHNYSEGWIEIKVFQGVYPLWWYMGNCWVKTMVFDQNNRFVEFRIRSDSAWASPRLFSIWGNCDTCCPEKKIWTDVPYKITKANKWTVVLLKIPPTTGGSQNIVDTVGSSLTWFLNKGNYDLDYIKIGEAAIPPIPVINLVKDQYINPNGIYNIPLTGISIPNRFLEGLKINVEYKDSNKVIRELSLLDTLGNPFKINDTATNAMAILKISVDTATVGLSDSVFITLADTIRNTSTTTAFKVIVVENTISLASSSAEIILYPNPTTGIVTIEIPEMLTGEINVADMVGNTVSSQKITAAATAKVDLSAVAPGIYIIRISDGKDVFYQKVSKK